MRSTRRLALIFLAAAVLAAGLATPAAAARPSVSFEYFHSGLAPHGTWHVSARFGRVWQPPVVYQHDWHPYAHGHWTYSEYGWTWVSDYRWGAIPYHYGTWAIDPIYGWVWVPGYVWAPAWVTFRSGPSYIGWGPVLPGFSVGASFGSGYSHSHFVFVSSNDFLSPHIHRTAFKRSRVRDVYRNTKIVNRIEIENGVVVNRGPDPRSFARGRSGRHVPVSIAKVPKAAPFERVTREALRARPDPRDEKVAVVGAPPKPEADDDRRRDRRTDRRERDEPAPARPARREVRDDDRRPDGRADRRESGKPEPAEPEAREDRRPARRERSEPARDPGPGPAPSPKRQDRPDAAKPTDRVPGKAPEAAPDRSAKPPAAPERDPRTRGRAPQPDERGPSGGGGPSSSGGGGGKAKGKSKGHGKPH